MVEMMDDIWTVVSYSLQGNTRFMNNPIDVTYRKFHMGLKKVVSLIRFRERETKMINQWKTKRKSYLAQGTRIYPEGICSLT